MAYACEVCGFELWHLVAAFDTSVVGLVDDDHFPGRPGEKAPLGDAGRVRLQTTLPTALTQS